jgi:hypothetical protein
MSISPKTTWKELRRLTGGLSAPSKMPGYAWNISAFLCMVGSILRKAGKPFVCAGCYALKGRYVFPNTIAAMERRFQAWKGNPEAWAEAMGASILKAGIPWFRWFDSGDLQTVDMLRDIVGVCRETPGIAHWLPTRERDIVGEYLTQGGKIPRNLTIRLSSPRVGSILPVSKTGPLKGIPVSGVHSHGAKVPRGVFPCPAPLQGGECGECRECWNGRRKVVSYTAH